MIKKVVLDKADRLYHFPLDIDDYFPRRTLSTSQRRLPLIDLGHFHWPISDENLKPSADPLKLATPQDLLLLKQTLSSWLEANYSISADPRREIYIGHGIRRIIFDLCLAFVEPGDMVLCPEPGMPAYRRCVIAAGGIPISYLLTEKSDHKPSFKKLSPSLLKTAKIIILNNPHNPLGSILDDISLSELIQIASKNNIFVVNDAAYSCLSWEKYFSLLSIYKGEKVALEIFSFPFTFGLPHTPLGFAVGSSEIVNGLETAGKVAGLFIPKASIEIILNAIKNYPSEELRKAKREIDHSRLAAIQLAEQFGWKVMGCGNSPFVWLRIPGRRQSLTFANTLLRRRGILTLPGTAFGESGEGYLRLSLTAEANDFKAAGERLSRRIIFRNRERE
jgi:LL-diaminopimelate aminotransferase